jgi:hypothetical protein
MLPPFILLSHKKRFGEYIQREIIPAKALKSKQKAQKIFIFALFMCNSVARIKPAVKRKFARFSLFTALCSLLIAPCSLPIDNSPNPGHTRFIRMNLRAVSLASAASRGVLNQTSNKQFSL